METKERKDARREILANFQFYIDERSRELFEGITTNVSSDGFSFLTKTMVEEGQTITITWHALPDFSGQKAKVIWVRRGPRSVEAGSKI